jgi:tRNA nucleotidyltransferase (CCA-adding enzyme)
VAVIETGLLNDWLPGINSNYSGSTLSDGLKMVITALELIDRTYPALSQLLHTNLRPTINMTGAGVALLAFLLQPIAASSEQLLIKLTVSTTEIKAIQTAITYFSKLAKSPPEELVAQYHLFREVGTVFPVAVILSLASSQPLSKISHLIERYLDPSDPLAHPVPLLNGTELMQALSLQPSPLVGQLLQELQLAQVCNKIRTKPEAVNYALTSLKKLSSCYI